MGSKAANRRKFLTANPVCCFCGSAPATTEDHVPARVCFKDRVWPEGFVFPACADCNGKDRASELVVAFHIHSMTENVVEFTEVMHGLRNNFPEALPDPFMSPGAKAKALSKRGITLRGHQIPFAPIVKLAAEADEHFHRFTRKLAKAIYYKVTGQPAPAGYRFITHWTTADQPDAEETIGAFVQMMPQIEVGARGNTDLGNQFAYRFNASIDRDVLIFTANFSDRFFLSGMGGLPGSQIEFDRFLGLSSWRETA